jgi:hypothetical protein
MVHVVEHLLSKHEALSSNPSNLLPQKKKKKDTLRAVQVRTNCLED